MAWENSTDTVGRCIRWRSCPFVLRSGLLDRDEHHAEHAGQRARQSPGAAWFLDLDGRCRRRCHGGDGIGHKGLMGGRAFLLGAACVHELGLSAVLLLELFQQIGQWGLGEHGAHLSVFGLEPRQKLREQLVGPFGAPGFACAVAHPFADAVRHARSTGDQHPMRCLARGVVRHGRLNELTRVLGIIDVHDNGVHEVSLKWLRGESVGSSVLRGVGQRAWRSRETRSRNACERNIQRHPQALVFLHCKSGDWHSANPMWLT